MEKAFLLIFAALLLVSVAFPRQVAADGCACEGDECGCCAHIKFKEAGIKFDHDVCVNVSYVPATVAISITVSIDGDIVFNETKSVMDPDFCFGIPHLKFVDLCVHFYDTSLENKTLHSCVKLEFQVFGKTVFQYKLGCFDIPIPELLGQIQENTGDIKPLASNGISCWMCKKLLPYVGKHECAEKCKAWWSYLQSSCDWVCDELISHLPDQYPCAAAGYCPW